MLADSSEFHLARQRRPLEADDAIFAFFSSAFFRGLMSPQYQIEVRRRLRAAVSLQIAQLARLAAEAEGEPADTLEDLCGLEPGDSEPAPDAPRPSERNEIAPILIALVGSVIEISTPVRLQAPPVSPALVRTHNETRALLCIWRM